MKNSMNRRNIIKGAALAGASTILGASTTLASEKDTCKKAVNIFKTDLELYGPCNGYVDLISAIPAERPFQNTLLVGRDLPGSDGYRADYGGHYHIDSEVIYITRGKVEITIRENSGKKNSGPKNELEELAPSGLSRKFRYKLSPKLEQKIDSVSLAEKSYVVERGGFIEIPGYAFHNVKVIEEADMVAYLPDARRLAEFLPTQPPTCER